jgi:UDP-2-acetamido-2-deoxy-ribo-hexuluronate aminotransferase
MNALLAICAQLDNENPMQFIDLNQQYKALKNDIDLSISEVLKHQVFIQGKEVSQLENALARFTGARRVVTCANGSDALQLALMAYNIGPGDAVFVPSFTYTATAEVILLLGAHPIFVDSDAETYNIDFESLEAAIHRTQAEGRLRPAALMTVDLFGQPVDYDRARSLADQYKLVFISDAAQGFGASYKNQRIGSGLADVTTSFFPAKPLGCYGDGGAIFTENDDIADIIRSICQHGKGEDKYDVVRVGVNSRLDTLQAAILLPKLAAFPDEIEKRNTIANEYVSRLKAHVATPLLAQGDDRYAWAQFTIKVKNRDALQLKLKDAGIPTMVYYPKPMHMQPAYLPYGGGLGSLPVAEHLSETVLSLPMHPYLRSAEIENICASVITNN